MNKIIEVLKQKKSIPLDRFINLALYDKKFGYYSKKNPFGKYGDYTTSPLVSNLFGEMIALWCISFWKHLGEPKKFLLVELGPGDGSLINDILKVFIKFPKFYSSLEINLFESDDHKELANLIYNCWIGFDADSQIKYNLNKINRYSWENIASQYMLEINKLLN